VFGFVFVCFTHALPLAAAEGHLTQKSAELTRLYSQMHWLGQYNADLVLWNINTNTQLTSLGVRQCVLEEELARTAGERVVQKAVAEQKAQETESQTAELHRVRTAFEQKEAELQREKTTVATLTGALEEKEKALEEKEVVMRNAEAALKEKEDSLSSLEEAARVQQEEAQKNIAGVCSKFRCRWILFFSQLILVPLIRAKAESGRRDYGEGGDQHRAHGGAGGVY
jgi:chromosome segregation ATPase